MPNPFAPLQPQRSVLADQVYGALCQYIVEGRLPPGERLREAQTAAALGVSRTPVRAAFARLERQNLLAREAGGAYRVSRWDPPVLWEVATLRAALEGLAMRLACPNVTPADIDRLEEVIAQMEAAARRSDDERLIALDIAFHERLWQRAGHTLLQAALEEMKAQVLYFMYATRPGDEPDYPASHRALLAALQYGDCEQAGRAIEDHIRGSAERAIRRLGAASPPPVTPHPTIPKED